VQNAVVCAWSDCMGVNGALDSNGNPQKYVYLSNADGCAKDPANNSIDCHVAFPGPGDSIFIGYSPALEPCGWDLACHAFVGFGNLFVNGKPSGPLELAGAELGGVGSLFGGEAVAAYGPAAAGAISGYASTAASATASAALDGYAYATDAVLGVYTNPELIEGLGQFVDGFNPLGGIPTSRLGWIGLGLGAAYSIYDRWHQ